MGFLSQASDVYSSLRFLRLLTTRWEDTNAFKYGIVDKDGKQLIKSKDVPPEHKKYYTLFHRLVFNIKRLLQKVPIVGHSILPNYASALMLLKEHLGIETDDEFRNLLSDHFPDDINKIINTNIMTEGLEFLKSGILVELNKDMVHPKTYEPIFLEGSQVRVLEQTNHIFGIPIYRGIHESTNQELFLSIGDCKAVITNKDLNEDGGMTAAVGASTATTSAVGNLDVAFKPKKKDRNISVFDVDDESFARLMNPKIKHKRWKDYLNTEHERYSEIRKCVASGDMVILRDSKGNACTIRNYKKA